jgi:transketolase
MTVAEAFVGAWLGPEIVKHHTYALVGDGCLQERVGCEMTRSPAVAGSAGSSSSGTITA